MTELLTALVIAALPAIAPEYLIFGGAGLITLLAFAGLILAPALSAYGRVWEKAAATFVSLFVLAALVLIGVGVGVVVFLNWNEIVDRLGF